MLSGKQPFAGETLTDTLASVVRGEPDWEQLPTTTPAPVKRLIKRCLEKDAKRRLRDIGDARFELDQTDAEPIQETTIAANKSGRSWLTFLLIGVLIVLAALLGAFFTRRFEAKPAPAQVIRTELELPSDQTPSGDARTRLAISPDGTKVVYVAKQRLYLRSLDSLESVAIAGTDGANSPFFFA